ncbi:Spo0B domain-containing protein [Oceanobacillus massiliensis]|uniref:Spo0B domain-containing protein n=1 Tax=Oceanobacillus massiliensis TaxID=1465765 RepID=UPI00301723D1
MSDDTIRVLQHYRHDLMNRLQIVQGYLGMGKADKAEDKLSETLRHYNEERKLMSLNMPAFMLWIIGFNHSYENFRLTYKINSEHRDLRNLDSILLERCQYIVGICKDVLDSQILYDTKLELEISADSPIKATLLIESESNESVQEIDAIKNRNESLEIDIDNTADGIIFGFSVPCQ